MSQPELFDTPSTDASADPARPLADRMRPRTLAEVVVQAARRALGEVDQLGGRQRDVGLLRRRE